MRPEPVEGSSPDPRRTGSGALRVGIIGCGGIGNSHAAAYVENPRVELIGVHDVVPERAEAYAERYGTTAYPTRDALLAQQPDLVSIATPPGTHVDVAVAVLEAGTSMLLEKPPTINLAELDRIAAAEQASTGSVYVVFQHRHGSGARRAKQLLESGALGTPHVGLCETLWYRPNSYFDPEWRGNWAGEGGGPTLGHGIHQIDMLLHLMGPWQTVDARSARIARPVEFEDVSMAVVSFPSGALATVVTSLLSPRELSRIRLDTDRGTLEVNHVYGYRDADWSWAPVPDAERAAQLGRDPGRRRTDGDQPDPTDDVWTAAAGVDRPSNHAAQIDQLVDDLLAGNDHDTTLAGIRPTMELVTALYASSLTGETVARADLAPGGPFYTSLSGGLPANTITARLSPGRTLDPHPV